MNLTFNDWSALVAFLLLFGTACARVGYILGKRSRPAIKPTRLQMALSASVHREIRANRMHGIFDGWELAHRTDSDS